MRKKVLAVSPPSPTLAPKASYWPRFNLRRMDVNGRVRWIDFEVCVAIGATKKAAQKNTESEAEKE